MVDIKLETVQSVDWVGTGTAGVQVLSSNIICPERGGEHIVFILVERTLETFMLQPATLTN